MLKEQSAIERRFAKITAVTGLSSFLSIGFQLASVPICLSYWGSDTYGAWLALLAAVTLMRSVDGGYSSYVGNKLNMLYHQDDQLLRVTLASAFWGATVLSSLQLVTLTVLYTTNGLGVILGTSQDPEGRRLVLPLLVFTVSWILTGSYLGIAHRLLIPTGLMFESAWWSLGLQLSQFCALITAALLGLTILQAAFLFALIQSSIYVGSAIYIKSKLPRYFPWWRGPRWNVGVANCLRSVPFTLSSALQHAGTSGLVLLVAASSGSTAVPVFTTVRTLTNLWTTLTNVVTAPLLPDVVRFYASHDRRKLLAIQQVHSLLVGLVINLSILITFPFLDFLYAFWTGNMLRLDRPLLALMLAAMALAGLSALMSLFLAGVNDLPFILASAATRGGLALLLSALLLPRYGIVGLGFAVLFAELLVLAVTVHSFSKRKFAAIGNETTSSLCGWSWFSSGSVVVYLLVTGLGLPGANIAYWPALLGVVVGSTLAWRGLDPDIKGRVRLLFRSG